jgi:hypothetical protein
MRTDVSCMPRTQAAHYWAVLIVCGLLTGCATAHIKQPQQSGSTQCQREPKCVAMICRDPNDLATCYCPATLPDRRRQPLSPEECESTLGDPNYDHQVVSAGGLGGDGKGERGKTVKPDGTKYVRPSGATTPDQRASVQGKPCVDCGDSAPKMHADHKDPLVKQHYERGGIDKTQMRSPEAVQPQCPTCSNRQGADLSRYSREKAKALDQATGPAKTAEPAKAPGPEHD